MSRTNLAVLLLLPALAAAAAEPEAATPSMAAWQKAMNLSDQQRYDEALTVIRSALAKDADSTDLRWLEAGVLGWAGRHRESVARYESLVEDHPELENDVRIELGTQRLWAGYPRDALSHAEQQLSIDPTDAKARRLRALALAHADRYKDALEAYDELLQENPDDVGLATDRATVLAWMGKNDRAVEAFEATLEAHPDDARARIGLAQNENWRGNHRRAAELFEELLRQGHDDPEVLKGLAYANYWADQPEAARAALERFAAVRREDREALQLSAMLRFEDHQTLSGGFEVSDDSDDQQIRTATLDYRLPLAKQFAVTALVREDRVEDPGGIEDPLRVGIGVEKRWSGRFKAMARAYHYDPRNAASTHGLGQASLSYRPAGRFAYELGFEIEPVVTRQSLALDIRTTNAAAAISFRAADRVTVGASAQFRDYSDDNRATLASMNARWALPAHRRSRFTALFAADLLQADQDLDHGYYDPERYYELGPGVEWTTELGDRLTFRVRAQTGYQQEQDAEGEVFYKLASGATVPLGRALRLEVDLGWTNSSLSSDSGFEQTRGAIYLSTAF